MEDSALDFPSVRGFLGEFPSAMRDGRKKYKDHQRWSVDDRRMVSGQPKDGRLMVGRAPKVGVSVIRLGGLTVELVERGPACALPGVT